MLIRFSQATAMNKKSTGGNQKRGRPPIGFDKKAYMKEYMRKRRLALKQAKT